MHAPAAPWLVASLALVAQASPAVARDPGAPAARIQAQPAASVGPKGRGAVSLVWLEAPARELPLEVRLEADPALTLLGNRLGWADVVDPGAHLPRVEARLRAGDEIGAFEVRAQVRYWVCGPELCWLRDGEARWSVTVVAETGARDPVEAPARPRG